MHSHTLLHKMLLNTLPTIHKKRIKALTTAVQALLIGKKLTLTLLGRNIQGPAKERNQVRKMDRLLGNPKLHEELPEFYAAKARLLLSNLREAILIVDWSSTDKRKDWHILRASVAVKGRSEVIYQEVHADCCLNTHQIHKNFLHHLKKILPPCLHVTILTDAGFCNPWFKEVKKLGYDWIGRTKSSIQYKLSNGSWQKCAELFDVATNKPVWVGAGRLAKTNPLECHIISYRTNIKGRVCRTRGGKKAQNSYSQRIGTRHRTPWILVTSLSPEKFSATQIIKLYQKRMQIEENFRDTKSTRYGFSLRESLSKNSKRLEVLLLIGMLASLICWLLAIEARSKQVHYDYQANSEKHRPILSAIYLGCQLVRRRFSITWKQALAAITRLRQLIAEAAG
jgi:hypothetical protein